MLTREKAAPACRRTIARDHFGKLPGGESAELFTLVNASGMQVKLTNYGGIITEIHVPDRHGRFADVVLGYDNLESYLAASPYFGALIGRYANRIARGRFMLDGEPVQLAVNDGDNHLHGGSQGFDKQLWSATTFTTDASVGVALSYRSPHGEQGYPGTLDVVVRYELTDSDSLIVQYHAMSNRPTPVNLTQHTYFNLAGQGDILSHQIAINADLYTPVSRTLIPLGAHAPVAGTPLDFRMPHAIGERIGDASEQLAHGQGYDHNFVLNKVDGGVLSRALRVHEPVSGRALEVFTTEPGLQFYSGNFLDGSLSGKGRSYGHRSGFCIEPQHFPDSPNQPSYPNTILRPGVAYWSLSRYQFSVQP